jgi:hypothetical protein
MQEANLPDNLPKRLQKDVLSTWHEVPVADRGSHSECENYYTPRVFRWALEEWLRNIPQEADVTALRRVLPIALADTESFHAYLRVPEAFGETYSEELAKLNTHQAEVNQVKRLLDARASTAWWSPQGFFALLLASCAIAGFTLLH